MSDPGIERVLVTGAAGFIGYHLSMALLAKGVPVTGIDNLNDYYDVRLKEARLARLQGIPGFQFERMDIADRDAVSSLFRDLRPRRVLHMAAQAGVRYSLEKPEAYVDSNLVGFLNILEGCRHQGADHLVYASSSSVYGANIRMPFSVHHNVDHPVSLYAATKKSNELMAHAYSHLFRIPTTGLRFFTVYGPWGRPDMALYLFTRSILEGRPIDVFNEGRMKRDFTYVDDIVEGVLRVMDRPPAPNPEWNSENPDPGRSQAPYRIYNIGNDRPVELMQLIRCLEQSLGRTAEKRFLPMQPGDVLATWADVDDLAREIDFHPATPIEEGIPRFVAWYREYHGV
ncbi:MAG: NAD-dependent epimerase [Verrucomicrobiota bacterium]